MLLLCAVVAPKNNVMQHHSVMPSPSSHSVLAASGEEVEAARQV